ncbi:hypothetical protein VP01_5718g2, partial [Puccinia sorghi]
RYISKINCLNGMLSDVDFDSSTAMVSLVKELNCANCSNILEIRTILTKEVKIKIKHYELNQACLASKKHFGFCQFLSLLLKHIIQYSCNPCSKISGQLKCPAKNIMKVNPTQAKTIADMKPALTPVVPVSLADSQPVSSPVATANHPTGVPERPPSTNPWLPPPVSHHKSDRKLPSIPSCPMNSTSTAASCCAQDEVSKHPND